MSSRIEAAASLGYDTPYYGAWPTLVRPTVAHRAREWSTRLGMVAAGLGVCLLPGMAVSPPPQSA
ncbi:hypothetical protein JW613_21415 [Streptomyces smyrnaeus]|uniref:Uncharacterized protein n=1 Tax=Streptomyces smyrnaeus TaxID=1387713 RepID=A0ABS3XZN0_9ACTN|nr:hypothetical protein [Streptomyces smyrnaeus]MBO8200848.1 hypothetical protein [Streptomyces smyrnaeus]